LIANPFLVGKYVSEDYFCDRIEETAFLKKQVDNGRNTAIIAPRRLGKTGLIQHFLPNPTSRSVITLSLLTFIPPVRYLSLFIF
jgi:hypothetical protein